MIRVWGELRPRFCGGPLTLSRSENHDAVDAAEEAVDTIRRAGDEVAAQGTASLREGLHAAEVGVRDYAGTLAGQLGSMAEQVESMRVEDLLRAGGKLAKEKPVLFVLAAVAVGFAASRLLSEEESVASEQTADSSADDSEVR